MHPRLRALVGAGFVLLLINTGYIAAFKSPTIFYMGNVLLHLVLGVALCIAGAVLIARDAEIRRGTLMTAIGMAAALGLGLYLVWIGNLNENRSILNAHIIVAAASVALLLPFALRSVRG